MVKALVVVAAVGVIAICGMQAGYMLSGSHQNVAQVSATSTPAKGRIIQVDGGGGM